MRTITDVLHEYQKQTEFRHQQPHRRHHLRWRSHQRVGQGRVVDPVVNVRRRCPGRDRRRGDVLPDHDHPGFSCLLHRLVSGIGDSAGMVAPHEVDHLHGVLCRDHLPPGREPIPVEQYRGTGSAWHYDKPAN